MALHSRSPAAPSPLFSSPSWRTQTSPRSPANERSGGSTPSSNEPSERLRRPCRATTTQRDDHEPRHGRLHRDRRQPADAAVDAALGADLAVIHPGSQAVVARYWLSELNPSVPLVADPVGAVASLTELIRTECVDMDATRKVPTGSSVRSRHAGVFRLMAPVEVGGGEVDPVTFLDVVEAASYADGSVGWCVMIGGCYATFGGMLPPEGARTIYGDPRDDLGRRVPS